jgi:hypothetical protein
MKAFRYWPQDTLSFDRVVCIIQEFWRLRGLSLIGTRGVCGMRFRGRCKIDPALGASITYTHGMIVFNGNSQFPTGSVWSIEPSTEKWWDLSQPVGTLQKQVNFKEFIRCFWWAWRLSHTMLHPEQFQLNAKNAYNYGKVPEGMFRVMIHLCAATGLIYEKNWKYDSTDKIGRPYMSQDLWLTDEALILFHKLERDELKKLHNRVNNTIKRHCGYLPLALRDDNEYKDDTTTTIRKKKS